MKLMNIVCSVVALGLSLSGMSYASTAGAYFPPERINCMKSTTTSRIRCEGINHQYLTEDMYTARFDKEDDIFHFASGVAYFTPDMKESTVYYTYKNADGRIVRLKATSILLHPDFHGSSWIKVQDDLYICDAGYMNCPITDAVVDSDAK